MVFDDFWKILYLKITHTARGEPESSEGGALHCVVVDNIPVHTCPTLLLPLPIQCVVRVHVVYGGDFVVV